MRGNASEPVERKGTEIQQSDAVPRNAGRDVVGGHDLTGPLPKFDRHRPATSMPHLFVGRVLQQIGDYIELVTRFDIHDLQAISL